MSEPAHELRFGRRRRRRRRRSGEARRGLYLLPQLFTTGNLFFGFFAIVSAIAGQYDRAALALALAAFSDVLDGRVARISHSTSRFGAEYDSLADMVSFGVAPALLAFQAGNLAGLRRTGLVMAFLYCACAALRLARFNVHPSRFKGRFEGLPSPAAAGMVASTQWFVSLLREEGGIPVHVPEALIAGGLALLGLLMVSAVPYRSFKELDLRHSHSVVVLMVLVLALVIQEPYFSFFVILLSYVLSGPIEWAWRALVGRPLEELPEVAAGEPPKETTP